MHALTLTRTGGKRSTTDEIPIIGNPGIGNKTSGKTTVWWIVCLFASNMKSIEPIFFFSHCRASLCTGLGYRIALYPSLYAVVHCRADTPYCAVVCLFSLQTLRDFSEKRLPYASHLMSFCSLHKGFQALLIDESQHVLAHSAIVLRTHARSQQLLGRKSFDSAIVCSYVYLVNKNKP